MEKQELPLGLGMALARNEAAMRQFAALPETERQRIRQQAHGVQSKQEMQRLVDSLARQEGGPEG